MLLLPYERITLESSRSADELVTALAGVTRPPESTVFRPLIRPEETATFVGEVSKERLNIRRAIRYRNSFVPFVMGRILEASSGSRIEAIMLPHVAVLVIMAVFMLMLAPAAIISIAGFIQRGMFDELAWLPLVMLGGLYVACMAGFVPEAHKTKRILREIAGPAMSPIGISTWP